MKPYGDNNMTSMDEIPEVFQHPLDKQNQYPDSECPYCYIEEQRRRIVELEAENDAWAEKWMAERAENQRLREE